MNDDEKKFEKYAELTHDCWSDWMKYMFSKCRYNDDGTATIPRWAVERWRRQMTTPYVNLDDDEQEEDRKVLKKYYGGLF